MNPLSLFRNGLLITLFLVLFILFFIKKQDRELNWSIFYSALWVLFSLPIINFFCIELGYWNFAPESLSPLKIPYDLFFVWVVLWGIVPFYFFKGKYTLILFLLLFWTDLVLMPELENFGILQLADNWVIGELILMVIVWFPSYLWAKFYYEKTNLKFRSLFQVCTMTFFTFFIIPFMVLTYSNELFKLPKFDPILFQIILILTFPALCAVIDLQKIGKGTPFPYDKTSYLVRSGVYAYCRNPIQWSFTLVFIPLGIYYNSSILFFGSLISIAYTIGISNPQEYQDMEKRFGIDWINYKSQVPNWRFLWKPTGIPKGKIYFKKNCNQCEQIKKWFTNRNSINLEIHFSENFKHRNLLQVTYVDHLENEYSSVSAIAQGLGHINLIYASLGWFMRFPIIEKVLQVIIDTMVFEENTENCDIKK